MDKSLKSKGELTRHRNVLSRAERITSLIDAERWDKDAKVFGLPKVANRKVATRKKGAAAEKPAEGAAGGAAAPAAAGTAGKAPPAAGKAPPAAGKSAAAGAKRPAQKPGKA